MEEGLIIEFNKIPKHPRVGDVCNLEIYCPSKDYNTKHPEAFFFCHKEATNVWEVKPVFELQQGMIVFWYVNRNIEFVVLEKSKKSIGVDGFYNLRIEIISIIKSKKEK